jgi:carbamoyl-phosphate synthase small subunit
VVPAETSSAAILDLKPAGLVLSNGPGDPTLCRTAIENIKNLLRYDIPILGICLGHQLLALALGAKTVKMKFGHHGANHPVQSLETGQVFITSQNHGFRVVDNSLPSAIKTTHRSLFDGTLQGMKHRTKPNWSFQGHPEASPGPHDVKIIFSDFLASIQAYRNLTVKDFVDA